MSEVAWEYLNSENSWLPLILPLAIWIGGFLYCYLPSSSERPTFHNWQALHNVHNIGGIGLALVSIYFNDNTILNERVTILWSLGYFSVDLVDCLWRKNVAFSLHAIFCIVLGIGCYTSPAFRLLRINSKALLCELSSPFMHLAKQTREPLHFIIFALAFFACRIVWLPWFLSDLRHYDLTWYDFRACFLVAFYGLNVYWFYKILRIIFKAAQGNSKRQD
jgi:hypothetical protein